MSIEICRYWFICFPKVLGSLLMAVPSVVMHLGCKIRCLQSLPCTCIWYSVLRTLWMYLWMLVLYYRGICCIVIPSAHQTSPSKCKTWKTKWFTERDVHELLCQRKVDENGDYTFQQFKFNLFFPDAIYSVYQHCCGCVFCNTGLASCVAIKGHNPRLLPQCNSNCHF